MTLLTKATQITKDRLYQWRKRNEREGVPCTPVVLINSIHSDKPGIVINVVQEAPLENVLKIMQAACGQIEKTIASRNGNGDARQFDFGAPVEP